MKKYFKIVKDSNPSLRQKCEEVKEITPEIIDFVNEMHDYLIASQNEEISQKYNIRPGVGLAAPQVGRNIRALVVYFEEEVDGEKVIVDHRLINPRIILESVKEIYLSGGEGCLSVDKPHYQH